MHNIKEQIWYAYSKDCTRILTIGSLAGVISLLLFIAIYFIWNIEDKDGATIFYFCISLIGAPSLLWCFTTYIGYWWSLSHRKIPVLKINELGVYGNTSPRSVFGFIPWEAISRVKLGDEDESIKLVLNNTVENNENLQQLFNKQETEFGVKSLSLDMLMNMAKTGFEINLALEFGNIDRKILMQQINHYRGQAAR